MQMQMGMNMMQQQQAAAQSQVPTQTPWHQQQQPAQQHMPQQHNFGYGVQMPQQYGGMDQQIPNIQQMFNMGQIGGQRSFWRSGAECVSLMNKSKCIQQHNMYPTSNKYEYATK